ncbi:DUF2164 family protein [Pontiellaceae bacterium B12219]|nr:DUF2164 family protein [Pontiellaceae bacterium B12219]
MDMELKPAQKEALRIKLIALYLDTFDESLSDFKADQLLDAFLKELAPSIYNAALLDMKQFMNDRMEDLEALCSPP